MATQISVQFFSLAGLFGICHVLSWFKGHAEICTVLIHRIWIPLSLATYFLGSPPHFPLASSGCPELSPLFLQDMKTLDFLSKIQPPYEVLAVVCSQTKSPFKTGRPTPFFQVLAPLQNMPVFVHSPMASSSQGFGLVCFFVHRIQILSTEGLIWQEFSPDSSFLLQLLNLQMFD